MISEIRVYYEGHRLLKSGFDAFFKELRTRALEKRCRFRLIASGSGAAACHDFGTAVLANRDAWNKVRGAPAPEPDEMMEAWFHADTDALERFYRSGFNRAALKANPNIEQIPKNLERGLSAATKNCLKGDYFDNKTAHGPRLLESIDPHLVRKAAPTCQRLFQAVLAGRRA